MTDLFTILGIIIWFILGTLGYITYRKFGEGEDDIDDLFGLFLCYGALSFCAVILVIIYERIRDSKTDR